MKRQFKVGEVSKLFMIPQSTLRYYDEIGLFQPSETDPENQYRYYSVDQFVVLDTIIFLRKNGFTLKDIKAQLDQRTPQNTKVLLEKKLQEVQEEIQRMKRVAMKIEGKLSTIDEGLELVEEPGLFIKYYPRRPITFLYYNEPIDLIDELGDLYVQEMEQLSSPSMEYNGFFSGDIGTMVDEASLDGRTRLKYKGVFELHHGEAWKEEQAYLEEGWYACYPYKGSYASIKEGYDTLLHELEREAYERIGPLIEIAMLDDSIVLDPEDYVTVIAVRISR
ncbi:DNA-binding protein [Pontibacillus halophilus JSM 076056 = DSM 19796]|uniref:DNA-binding protein n=1 Tax=Pontibacillus halophilus JSM 076056 = DSM 19796 TaxID=1385510 RepID=A0A0A5GIU3_9BACI|nr:MerR family transcriptional regulator [Pontibacillus halophilus]KGX91055.1 DNA-binding protein [Pontibacillus halophilus JSM 076056 = DSM 19796]